MNATATPIAHAHAHNKSVGHHLIDADVFSRTRKQTKVLIMHAEPLLAMGLATALQDEAELEIECRSVGTHEGDVDLPHVSDFDAIVTDYNTALRLGSQVGRDRFAPRRAQVIVVTFRDRECDVRHALERGVKGYLLLDASPCEVIDGIRSVVRGSRFFSMPVASLMADSLTQEKLSFRESQVLSIMAMGHCNKSIAKELDLSLSTVKSHVRGILEKLNVRSRTEAVCVAMQKGMTANV